MTSSIGEVGGAVRVVPPTFTFVIEEGKAREFARATGADDLVRTDDGWLAPATFLTASQLWMAPENSAWHGITRDYRRVLHGEQRFDYPRGLPRVGDRFHARQRLGRAYEKDGARGRMSFQEVVTCFWRESEDNPDAVMTSLSITLPPVDQGAAPRTTAPAAPPPAADAIDVHTTEPLTITDFVRYQGASGDFNPIHHDAEFARAGGHAGPFAVGMLAAGVAASRFARVRDPRLLRSLRMRWKAAAWPGDRLTYTVTDGEDGIECAVTRDSGETHMIAWARHA